MKVLVLGMGLQGKAVVYDLEKSPLVHDIVVADLNIGVMRKQLSLGSYEKTTAMEIDARDADALTRAIGQTRADIVACMLPPEFGYPVARACIDCGVPFVSSSYTGRVAELDKEAREKGVTVLPEMGLDPGIDLVLARLAVSGLDRVSGLNSYGAGLPDPEAAASNPLGYKVTWRFDGVVDSYRRPVKYLKDGKVRVLEGTEIFHPDHIHTIHVDGFGELEAYRNGDALHFVPGLGLGEGLEEMGRFAMRYPGHADFWYKLIKLGFTEDEPVAAGGCNVSPRRFLIDFLTPKLQFGDRERDAAIVRVTARGRKDGAPKRITYELIDYRDLSSGLFAMNRTVGFTTSIGIQMILSGAIQEAGVLSPTRHVEPHRLIKELEARGIRISRRESDSV